VAVDVCLTLRFDVRRPLQPLELLKYLSEIVVSLVERLKPDGAAQPQRQLASNAHASGASGAGAAATAAPRDVAAVVHGQCAALRALLDPRWQAALAAQDNLGKLAADAGEVDLEALLRELQLGKAHAASPAQPNASAPDTARDEGSKPSEPASDEPAAQARSAPASSIAAGEGSVPTGGLTVHMAQQVVGLQQQMSRAMQSLASLGRGSLEGGGDARLDAAADAATTTVTGQAGALAASAQTGNVAPDSEQQQLNCAAQPMGEAQLASLRSILGPGAPTLPPLSSNSRILCCWPSVSLFGQGPMLPCLLVPLGAGVEVLTADEYRVSNPGEAGRPASASAYGKAALHGPGQSC
jgi:cell division septum initiation protein DivIVA